MKKTRIFIPLMAAVAASTPALTALTSCSRTDYSEMINALKDESLSIFIDLAKNTHRGVWDQTEIYDYIRKSMQTTGFAKPAGSDYWSQVPEVEETIRTKTGKVPGSEEFPKYGNIWYDLPATAGFENVPKVIIHAHMDSDMAFKDDAAEKEWQQATSNIIDVIFDRDNDLLKTSGKTSLGADNGLGIAFMLALARLRNDFKHGGIRLLFTAGESEATTHYAAGSDFLYNDQIYDGKEFWEGKPQPTSKSYLAAGSAKPFGNTKDDFPYIISTSGIYKNCVYRSCGGIHECEYNDNELNLHVSQTETDKYKRNTIQWESDVPDPTDPTKQLPMRMYTITLSGLHGGQSAKNINLHYGSALYMLAAMCFSSDRQMQIVNAESRPGAYAISSYATFTLTSVLEKEEFQNKINAFMESYKTVYSSEDWTKVKCELTEIPQTEAKSKYNYGLSGEQTRAFLKLCAHELSYGPVDWFDKDHTSVRTSCNFGNLKIQIEQSASGYSHVEFHNVCRSADHEALYIFYSISHGLFDDCFINFYEGSESEKEQQLIKHMVHIDDPVWEVDPNNKIIPLVIKGYENMGINAKTWDNHGWVEIGCFTETYEDAFGVKPQMTCFGPEIRNSKEITEEVWTDTLNPIMGAVLYTLDNIKNL